MTDLIERLRSVKWDVIAEGDRMPDDPTRECVFVDMRPADFSALLTEAADALEAAQEDACVALVADIRLACGDNGKRMQPELVEFIRGLAADSARYQWLRARWGRIAETYEDDRLAFIGDEDAGEGWVTAPDSLDAAIDAAIARGTVASP